MEEEVMGSRTPSSPLRAYHRYMRACIGIEQDNIMPTPEELDRVALVFRKAGGSWEGLFKGSLDDSNLLRKTIKVAIKKGYLSKSPQWEE